MNRKDFVVKVGVVLMASASAYGTGVFLGVSGSWTDEFYRKRRESGAGGTN